LPAPGAPASSSGVVMMLRCGPLLLPLIVCWAAPLHAASGPFLSLGNTDFVVLISFVLFIAAMIRFRAPHFAGKLLDGQIARIRERIEEAETLQAEAREILTALEGRQSEAANHAENIVNQAREDAGIAIKNAEKSIAVTVENRLAAARLQIETAKEAAVLEIRNRAIDAAIQAASEVMADSIDDDFRKRQVAQSLADLESSLN